MRSDAELIYESRRRFEVSVWGVGHRGLILRSNPASDATSRIEVWFKPAYAVSLPSWLDGVHISRVGTPPTQTIEVLGRPVESGEDIFIVRSGQVAGWVVAGGVHGREDDHEFHEPTMFDGWEARPDVRELFSFVRADGVDA